MDLIPRKFRPLDVKRLQGAIPSLLWRRSAQNRSNRTQMPRTSAGTSKPGAFFVNHCRLY
jgi:hypothetical protein